MAVPTLEEVRRALTLRPPELLPERLPRQAAVSIVLREPPSGLEVLFIRRAEREGDLWSGHVAFPGAGRSASPSSPGSGRCAASPVRSACRPRWRASTG